MLGIEKKYGFCLVISPCQEVQVKDVEVYGTDGPWEKNNILGVIRKVRGGPNVS